MRNMKPTDERPRQPPSHYMKALGHSLEVVGMLRLDSAVGELLGMDIMTYSMDIGQHIVLRC